MKKYILLFTLVICTSQAFAVDVEEAIKNTVSTYLSDRFLNASFVIADEEKDLVIGAKGLFSTDGLQLKPDQQMPIASGTKSITAAGILRLQEKRLLDVKDKISKYLNDSSTYWGGKEAPKWVNQITLHQLLTHTSGLVEYLPALKIDINKSHADINLEILNFAASEPLNFNPGTKFLYSNTNYVVLGLIIEQVSGKTLNNFFKDEFFDPLGMQSTHLATLKEALQLQNFPETTDYPRRYFVIPNNTDKPDFIPAKVDFTLVPYADGGVVSTAHDLITWHRSLHQGKVLSDKSYKMMITKYVQAPNRMGHKNYAGYGIFIFELPSGNTLIYHAGNAVAIRSEAGYVPEKNLYFAILSNIMVQIPAEMKNKIDPNNVENQLDILYFREAILKTLE
jgi:CubicO group peptidase (beta-lactamase class C family)